MDDGRGERTKIQPHFSPNQKEFFWGILREEWYGQGSG
jgi:hypothetical protein